MDCNFLGHGELVISRVSDLFKHSVDVCVRNRWVRSSCNSNPNGSRGWPLVSTQLRTPIRVSWGIAMPKNIISFPLAFWSWGESQGRESEVSPIGGNGSLVGCCVQAIVTGNSSKVLCGSGVPVYWTETLHEVVEGAMKVNNKVRHDFVLYHAIPWLSISIFDLVAGSFNNHFNIVTIWSTKLDHQRPVNIL